MFVLFTYIVSRINLYVFNFIKNAYNVFYITHTKYFTTNKDILWFIPLSSKVDKYKKIIDKKVKKYGVCNTIMIRNILGHESAILLQNAFPTLEKYIDHIHVLENGKPAKVIDTICDEILENFNQIMKLKRIGINLFFTNIDYIKEKMLDELKID